MNVFAIISIVALVGSGLLMFAKDQAGTDLLPQSKNIFFAVLVAFMLGVGGYAKSTTPETFDPAKFLVTLVLSIIIGFAMHFLHFDYATAQTAVTAFFVNTGLLAPIEVWLKVIVRQISVLGTQASKTASSPA